MQKENLLNYVSKINTLFKKQPLGADDTLEASDDGSPNDNW